MSSLFLLVLLFFYCKKFSSARCSALISLCKSLTRCLAAFSLLSLRFRDGFWKYLFLLRSLSVPSFIMRFFNFEIALSALSWRLSFTVSMFYSWLMSAAAVQQLVSVYPLHEYCTTHYWVCQGVGRHPEWPPEVERTPCAVLCYSVSLRWRFGLFEVGCGWWGALLPLIRMTCSTQQYAAIRTYSPSTPL